MASDYDLPPPGPRAPDVAASSDYELPAPGYGQGPAQPATQPATYNGEDLWLKEQQAQGQGIARAVAQQAEEARRAKLQQEHGAFETVSGQFARGVFDALLAPGALVGAAAQGLGETVGNKTIADIGRDLGRASSGKSAVEALGYIFGGGGEEGLERSDLARQRVDEQEEARPMLSTVSRMAGQAWSVMTAGSGAVGESGVLANIGLNAAEGAAGGAQGAYERSASLRDVLSSAAVGGILGGSIAGVAEGADALLKKTPDLAKVFGEKLQGFADTSAVKAVIDRDPGAWKTFMKGGGGEERIARVADRIRAADVLGKGDQGMLEALQVQASKAGDDLAAVAKHLDESGVKPDVGDLLKRWDDQVEKLRASGSGTNAQIADALEREVAPFKAKLVLPEEPRSAYVPANNPDVEAMRQAYARAGTDAERETILNTAQRRFGSEGLADVVDIGQRARMAAAGAEDVTEASGIAAPKYREPTFTELRTFKQALGQAKAAQMRSNSLAAGEINKLYGSVAQSLNDAADSAGPAVSKLWRQSNEAATDYIELSDALERQMIRRAKNRFISPSDYGTSIGAGLATIIHTGNPIAAGAAAIGTALGHHALREGGRELMASLSNRFARMSSRLAIPGDVGPEMQQVLEHMAKTTQFVKDTASRAGDNPTAVAAASDAAKNVAAGVAAKKAGQLDLAAWADKPLNPMQKVLYRGPVLDRVSSDLSKEAARIADMAPEMPAELDARRIARLTRDADGPEAIGGVQQAIPGLLQDAPPTPTGYAAGVALRQLADDINSADLPAVMTRTHATTNALDDLAGSASDQPSRDFAQRAILELRGKLGADAFGQAGKQYAALTKSPSEFLENLYNQDALREVLRSTNANGQLGKNLSDAQRAISDAHDAAFKLAGQRRPADLGRDFQKSLKMFKAAEDAVTLDGSSMTKLFDAANRAGVYAGDQAYLHTTDVGDHTVRETMDQQVSKLAPIIKQQAGIETARYKPLAASRVAGQRATAEDPSAQYDERMQKLNNFVSDPTQIKGGMYAGIGPDVGSKLAQLLNDMPKPTKSLMGSAGSQLSSEDLRLSNAMWEATTKPLSVFDDFARGSIDYDKVHYAWKQYPGLQEAAQAGTLDLLTHDLDEKQRGKIPQPIITQLDNLLGFNGKLQDSLDPGFSARMSQLYQPQPNKPAPGGELKTPKAEPTFTERLGGAGSS